jgi:hypothetical protein
MVLDIKVLDIIDVFLVAFILFQLYKLIRGTAALSIFIGIFFIYMFCTEGTNMELISLTGTVIGVGYCADNCFSTEVRRFLLL